MLGTPTEVLADGVVHVGVGSLVGCVLVADAGEDATLTLYDDDAAAQGNVLLHLAAAAGTTASFGGFTIPCTTGVYADITGTGAKAVVYL